MKLYCKTRNIYVFCIAGTKAMRKREVREESGKIDNTWISDSLASLTKE